MTHVYRWWIVVAGLVALARENYRRRGVERQESDVVAHARDNHLIDRMGRLVPR